MTKETAAGSVTKSLSYSSYDAVVGMTGTGSPAPTITFLYGSDRNRIQQNHSVNGVTSYVYAGSAILFERLVKNTTTTKTHYLYAGGLNFGTFVTKTGAANDTRYFHRDHLGSVDAVTNTSGSVIERMSFDAWGARRNTDWSDATGPITVTSTLRGFTGHEMLDALGLIHMNGRVYNPVLGKFLSADPFIQFASNLQSYNRYSYVLNNPLSYTDPDGYFLGGLFKSIFKAISSIFKAITSFISSILRILPGPLRTIAAIAVNFIPGINIYTAGFLSGLIASGGDLRAGIIGALTAGAFSKIGDFYLTKEIMTGKLSIADQIMKTVAHGVVGGASSALQGGNFLSGFLSSGSVQGFGQLGGFGALGLDRAADGLGGLIKNAAVSAIIGGTSAVLGGGKFASGALTGAFSRLFNDVSHYSYRLAKAFDRALDDVVSKMTNEGRFNYYAYLRAGGQVVLARAPYALAPQELWINTDKHGVIYWHPDRAVLFDNGSTMPPGMALEHELDHGLKILTQGSESIDLTPDGRYMVAEERRVVTGSEARAAAHYGVTPRTCYPCGKEIWL